MSIGDSASQIGKVRGLGSAREGGDHWLAERLTSVALVLLGAWFLAALLMLPNFDQQTLREWLRSPTGAIPMALFAVTSFIHAADGLKQVVDDYVHTESGRWATNTFILFAAIAGASLCLFALGKIAFGAAA
ncbi:succinate dehydrogenase, hydrophobic membrane anchor protein [Sphingomonas sabuli]|uniref:Succinate dehydrogenase hydrophobic membrane anchor subunit n=1 Tax=Sphingomonas sabuli TaxID=2764186 RepID=A0A7G9L5F2_9SPHN|nr:succinate dehydrogenase, hydrophobic membrane anchor protein [Sphingomonas sabuli]QNM83851.1 succinate dehydrogenase, hydrophobic membrane anchor protein [Sphingomonas sabuli]